MACYRHPRTASVVASQSTCVSVAIPSESRAGAAFDSGAHVRSETGVKKEYREAWGVRESHLDGCEFTSRNGLALKSADGVAIDTGEALPQANRGYYRAKVVHEVAPTSS